MSYWEGNYVVNRVYVIARASWQFIVCWDLLCYRRERRPSSPPSTAVAYLHYAGLTLCWNSCIMLMNSRTAFSYDHRQMSGTTKKFQFELLIGLIAPISRFCEWSLSGGSKLGCSIVWNWRLHKSPIRQPYARAGENGTAMASTRCLRHTHDRHPDRSFHEPAPPPCIMKQSFPADSQNPII